MKIANLKSKKILIPVALIIIGLVVMFLVLNDKNNNQVLNISTTTNEIATTTETKFSDNDIKLYNYYLADGIKYKGEGGAGNRQSYKKAIFAFQKACQISKNQFWIPFVNLGNTYREMGEFKNALESYNKALEISMKGEPSIFLAKIELYRYNLGKTDQDIRKLYEESLKNVTENGNLYLSYAAYLEDNKKYKEAKEIWERMLASGKGDKATIEDKIKELTDQIK